MIGLKRGVVELKPHNPKWNEIFEKEAELLTSTIPEYIMDIQHIGSTAIKDIVAKPIIDIALAINSLENIEKIIKPLEEIGYIYRGEQGIPGRHLFVKGSMDFRTHHLHVMSQDHYEWRKHILFRDYLRNHPLEAAKYSALKKQLEKDYKNDRGKYTDSKADFIQRIITKAEKVQD